MPIWIAVALGGASGSLARYALGLWARSAAVGLPVATLIVNTVGSFLIGCIFVATASRPDVPAWVRAGLMTGVMGGFTTFSAFSLETLLLGRDGQPVMMLLNVALNVGLSLGACALGLVLARNL